LDVADENGKFWQSIQDGSHPNAPTNKPASLLMELQNHLQDIAEGFDNRLTQVTRLGYRAFGSVSEAQPEPEDSEVSILPIIPSPEQSVDTGDIADALLSRGAEEVAAALERVNQTVEDTSPQSKEDSEGTEPLDQPSAREMPSPSRSPSADIDDSMEEAEPSASSIAAVQSQPIENVAAALSREQEKLDSVSSSQSVADSDLTSQASASHTTETEPTVSILPIEAEMDFVEPAQAILQRGKEEIEEALERAEKVKRFEKGQEE